MTFQMHLPLLQWPGWGGGRWLPPLRAAPNTVEVVVWCLFVGIQNAKHSLNIRPVNQSLAKSTEFDLKPWENVPSFGTGSKTVDLKLKAETC